MKLTAQIKLQPTPEQSAALRATLERANAACNAISAAGWAAQTFSPRCTVCSTGASGPNSIYRRR